MTVPEVSTTLQKSSSVRLHSLQKKRRQWDAKKKTTTTTTTKNTKIVNYHSTDIHDSQLHRPPRSYGKVWFRLRNEICLALSSWHSFNGSARSGIGMSGIAVYPPKIFNIPKHIFQYTHTKVKEAWCALYLKIVLNWAERYWCPV